MSGVLSPRRDQRQPPPDGRSGEPKIKVLRDFGGVNLQDSRQDIGDEDFYWLEQAQPIGKGKLRSLPPSSLTLQTITSQQVVAAFAFNLSGKDYDFLVMQSGKIYQALKTTPYTVTDMGASGFSFQTVMAQWGNTIILIVDPTAGYWYWNGSSLIAISNTLATLTITDPGVYGGTPPTVSFSGGGGSGAAADVYMGILTAKVNAGGTGYTVGDVLNVSAGGFTIAGNGPSVKVATLGASNAVATVTVENAGTILGAVGTTNLSTTGGTGNGATFDVTWGVTGLNISSGGSGYTSAPSVVFSSPAGLVRTAISVATASGALTGTSIATYAGRAWIGSGRTVSFTDVNSYTSFSGAGGAFTIDDETLHGNVTELFATNSFLYIWGDDSIDILGDVQVTDGVTSFTRQNVTSSVGTSLGASIFTFYRSIYFANPSGFYSLSGSTPQKLSENLDPLFPYIDFTKPVTGGQVMVNKILCPAWLFTFNDVIATNVGTRQIIAALCKGKWFFMTPNLSAAFVTSSPISGVATMFEWCYDGANSFFQQVLGGTGLTSATVLIMTKLYDGAEPMLEKQSLRVGVGVNWNGQNNSGASIRVFVDNEFGTVLSGLSFSTMPTGMVYTFTPGPSTTAGGKYLGFTISATVREIIFGLFAIEYEEGSLF